jgi:hypothetical protein
LKLTNKQRKFTYIIIASLLFSIKWKLYSQSELFRLIFIKNETAMISDWSDFFTTTVVLDFEGQYQKKKSKY